MRDPVRCSRHAENDVEDSADDRNAERRRNLKGGTATGSKRSRKQYR
jgi:hypothetical protein